jgi:hypothetical protein
MRNLKNADAPIPDGQRVYYSYIRLHQALEGKTPGELAGIHIKRENKWIALIQNVSKP